MNAVTLASYLAGLAAVGRVAVLLSRARRVRRSVPDRPVRVAADDAGLYADDGLLVATADVVCAEVAVDPDIGFAVLVRSRQGVTFRVPLRSEADARALAAALLPAAARRSALVFEGVSDGRPRETAAATGAAGGALALLAALGSLDVWGFWAWVHHSAGWHFWEHPERPAFWVGFAVAAFGYWALVATAVLAVKPILRRLRTGRVTIDREGLSLGEDEVARRIAREDIETVETGDAQDVRLGLTGGRSVRLRFAADRPLVERDAFVARVRAIAGEAPVETYPAAETSGVRVALRADDAVAPDDAVASDEAADAELQAPRARRR